jgi:hypothetical protein
VRGVVIVRCLIVAFNFGRGCRTEFLSIFKVDMGIMSHVGDHNVRLLSSMVDQLCPAMLL